MTDRLDYCQFDFGYINPYHPCLPKSEQLSCQNIIKLLTDARWHFYKNVKLLDQNINQKFQNDQKLIFYSQLFLERRFLSGPLLNVSMAVILNSFFFNLQSLKTSKFFLSSSSTISPKSPKRPTSSKSPKTPKSPKIVKFRVITVLHITYWE